MALDKKDSSVPTPPYDIQPNDTLDQNYEAPTDGAFDMWSEGSFCRCHRGELPSPTFHIYTSFPCLSLQTEPSISTSLSPISGSSTSLQGALNPSSEAGSFDGGDLDALLCQTINESMGVSEGSVDNKPLSTLEQELINRYISDTFQAALQAISADVSGMTVERAAQQTTNVTSEVPQGWDFDSYTSQFSPGEIFNHVLNHTPYYSPTQYMYYPDSPPLTATLEPVLESDNDESSFDDVFSS